MSGENKLGYVAKLFHIGIIIITKVGKSFYKIRFFVLFLSVLAILYFIAIFVV